MVQLLATSGYELATRVAILGDSDDRTGSPPSAPAWMDTYDEEVVQFFLNHPTLEPAITPGNESLIAQALSEIGLNVLEPVTPEAVDSLFQGTGRTHKGEFAYAVAAQIDALLASGDVPSVPAHVDALFTYLLPTEPTPGTPSDDALSAD